MPSPTLFPDAPDTRPIRERFPVGTPVGDAIRRADGQHNEGTQQRNTMTTNPITAALDAAKAVGVEAVWASAGYDPHGGLLGDGGIFIERGYPMPQKFYLPDDQAEDLTVAAIRRGLKKLDHVHSVSVKVCDEVVFVELEVWGRSSKGNKYGWTDGPMGRGTTELEALTAAMVAMKGAQDGD